MNTYIYTYMYIFGGEGRGDARLCLLYICKVYRLRFGIWSLGCMGWWIQSVGSIKL